MAIAQERVAGAAARGPQDDVEVAVAVEVGNGRGAQRIGEQRPTLRTRGREAAVAVAQLRVDLSVPPLEINLADHEVAFAVVVEVSGRHRQGRRVAGAGGRLKDAIAVAQQEVQRPIGLHGFGVSVRGHHRQVAIAVVVEVGYRERNRLGAAKGVTGGADGSAEPAPAVAQKHADGADVGVGVIVDRGQVEMAVVVKVRRRHDLGARADGIADGGLKASRRRSSNVSRPNRWIRPVTCMVPFGNGVCRPAHEPNVSRLLSQLVKGMIDSRHLRLVCNTMGGTSQVGVQPSSASE